MAHHNDVLNLEHIDRVLDDAQGVEVRVHQEIGDIAVYKQLTREQINEFVGGHAAVGTAQPHVSGFLLCQQSGEEARAVQLRIRSPLTVAVK